MEHNALAGQDSRSILVVDDHELVRSLLVTVLESAGYSVIEASSGPSALSILETRPADIACIVQDMSMPGMSGKETIEQVLEIVPDARIIVLSVDDEASVLAELGNLPITAYLEKPCDTDRLVDVVTRTIDGA